MRDKELFLNIGSALRKKRRLLGYKAADTFAIDHNLPESLVHRAETGHNITIKSLNRICKALQVNVKDIFNT